MPTSLLPNELPLARRPAASDEVLIDHLLEPAGDRDAQSADATLADATTTGHLSTEGSSRTGRILREEFQGLHIRLWLLRLLLWLLPIHVGGRLRALAMKVAGFRLARGTIFAGLPTFTGGRDLYSNLRIGAHCWFNVGCFFDLGAAISVGENVSFGHNVLVLTSSHVIGPSSRRAAGLRCRPIAIGDGAWIGARCTILPGVRIGDGAIVAAGAVVHEDVPANALVAGVPARVVRSLRQAVR